MTNPWPTTKLGDVIDLFDSQRIPLNSRQRQERQGKFPYYGAQGIIDYIDDYIFDGRYILVAEDGENLNSKKLPLALFATGKFWVNNHAHILRGKANIADDTYLLACLNNADIKPFVTGAAQPKLSQGNLRLIEIPLPPLPIQQRIAGILSAYDELIENSQRRIKLLEAMARALYREWFVHFRFPGHENHPRVPSPLGEIPQGWEVRELRDLFDIRYGKTLPKTEISNTGLYPVYGAGDVIGYYNKMLYSQKCALVTSRGNGSGTVWRTREAAFVTNNSLVILPKKNFHYWDYSFVELVLKHSNVMSAKTGSAQPQVTIENINYVTAIVPTMPLIERFCAIVTPTYELVDLLYRQIQTLRRTRDLLLPRLLSGQIDMEAIAHA